MLELHASQGKESNSTVDVRDYQHSTFENMLFDRVVAKSREEITDRDILDLDDVQLSNSNSGSPKGELLEPAEDSANKQTVG